MVFVSESRSPASPDGDTLRRGMRYSHLLGDIHGIRRHRRDRPAHLFSVPSTTALTGMGGPRRTRRKSIARA